MLLDQNKKDLLRAIRDFSIVTIATILFLLFLTGGEFAFHGGIFAIFMSIYSLRKLKKKNLFSIEVALVMSMIITIIATLSVYLSISKILLLI